MLIRQILQFIFETFFNLFIYVLLLRFYMQIFRTPAHNPLGNFVFSLTNKIVAPTRRFIPGFLGIDWSTFILAWLLELILTLILYMLDLHVWPNVFPLSIPFSPISLFLLALLCLVQLFRISLYLLIIVISAQAILSWVSPYNPLMAVLNSITYRFLRFFGKRAVIGNVDLSPLFVLVAVYIVLIVLNATIGPSV
jgi:YggT family protein